MQLFSFSFSISTFQTFVRWSNPYVWIAIPFHIGIGPRWCLCSHKFRCTNHFEKNKYTLFPAQPKKITHTHRHDDHHDDGDGTKNNNTPAFFITLTFNTQKVTLIKGRAHAIPFIITRALTRAFKFNFHYFFFSSVFLNSYSNACAHTLNDMSSMYLHITTEKIIKSKHLNCTFSIFHTLVGSFQSVLCSCSFTFIAKLQIFYMMNIITMSVMRNVCVSVGRSVCMAVFRFLSLSHSLFPSRSVLLSFFLICKHMCALWLKLEVFRCFVCILFSSLPIVHMKMRHSHSIFNNFFLFIITCCRLYLRNARKCL